MAGREATGILETRGMAALLAAADTMLKAAKVELCGRHGIGSGWVTVVVEGAVGAVETAIRAGAREARKYGELIESEVVARPEQNALEPMPHGAALGAGAGPGAGALGLLETRGLVPLLVGADAMLKAAAVELRGWSYIGGALVHALVDGEVAAVRTAVEAGRSAAGRAGEVYSTLVIPQPPAGLGALLPAAVEGEPQEVGALGLVETTGYVGAVGAADAMSKAAAVALVNLSIGSGGRIAALVAGALDEVQAAVEAGTAGAERAGELNAARVISRPDPVLMACFGGVVAGPRRGSERPRALGLIETRSTVSLVKALDEMLKSAEVEYEGRYKVGYFLSAGVIRGDVGAVRAALDVGIATAEHYGKFASAHLIPHPLAALELRLGHE